MENYSFGRSLLKTSTVVFSASFQQNSQTSKYSAHPVESFYKVCPHILNPTLSSLQLYPYTIHWFPISFLDIEELSRPIIQNKIENLFVEENQVVVIPCICLGNPNPIVKWYKRMSGSMVVIQSTYDEMKHEDGSKIQIRQGVLIINTVTPSHAGKYVCNATNSFGSDIMEVYDVSLKY